jgi:hypothetical protein
MKMLHSAFDKLTVAKSDIVKLSLWFYEIKKWFNTLLYLANTFWARYAMQLSLCIPWVGGCDAGVGRSSSSYPNSRILIEKPPLSLLFRNGSIKLVFKPLNVFPAYCNVKPAYCNVKPAYRVHLKVMMNVKLCENGPKLECFSLARLSSLV